MADKRRIQDALPEEQHNKLEGMLSGKKDRKETSRHSIMPASPHNANQKQKQKATFYIPKDMLKNLKYLGVEQEKSMSDLITEGLALLFQAYGSGEGREK